MMGLRIFLHSIKLVFGQLGAALRISAVLYILSIGILAVGVYFQIQAIISGGQDAISWQFYVASLFAALPYLFTAVAWHRFVLLDEVKGSIIPMPPGDRVWSYAGRIIQLSLLGFAIGIGFFLVLFVATMVSAGSPYILIPMTLIFFVLVFLGMYRLAPVLPGAAIGQPIGIAEAWASTSGATGSLILLAVLSAIGSMLLDAPNQFLPNLPGSPFTVAAWSFATAWIKIMVGVSILTTIYGVYVEKRSLA